jgi:CDP-paratose 2-epimerase
MRHKGILVTGGAGFIGSSLALSFKRKYPKIKVIALDNLKRRGSELNLARLKEAGVSFLHADIRNPEDFPPELKFDLMLECSAEPSVLAGYAENPLYVINTNLCGTINCLELARKNRADVIFLSTSRVYPYAQINVLKLKDAGTRFVWRSGQKAAGLSANGISEDFTTQGPKTLYGATKLASELLLQEYAAAYGIRAVVNRCGVVAGPWQFGRVDQGVFTLWMLVHYFGRRLNYIGFGGRGKQVRDLLHTDDLFRLIDIQASCLGKINGEVYNIGGGERVSLSLLEATRLCAKISGRRIKVGCLKQKRPGDIAVYLTDYSKASRELGWQPRRQAEEILRDTHRWIARYAAQISSSLF